MMYAIIGFVIVLSVDQIIEIQDISHSHDINDESLNSLNNDNQNKNNDLDAINIDTNNKDHHHHDNEIIEDNNEHSHSHGEIETNPLKEKKSVIALFCALFIHNIFEGMAIVLSGGTV